MAALMIMLISSARVIDGYAESNSPFNFLFLMNLNSKLAIISNQTKLNLNLLKMLSGGVMLTVLLLGIVTVALFGLFKLNTGHKRHRHYAKAVNQHADRTKPHHHFHSVSIVNDGSCCEQAETLSGKRFLSKDAPEIPMEECTMTQCQCRYQHHEDRRQIGNDRRVEYGVTRELFGAFGEQNRRDRPKGRRATDG